RLRDARIRSKLGLLLIVQLIAMVALAAVRLVDSGQRALSVDLVHSLAILSAESSVVSHELHRERMAAARLLADPERDVASFDDQTVRTDEVIAAYREYRDEVSNLPVIIEDRLDQIDRQLETVTTIRQDVRGDTTTLSAATLRYGAILNDIIEYQEALGQVAGDVELAESIRAVAAISKAKRYMAETHATAYLGLLSGDPNEDDLTGFLAARTGQQEALLAFNLAANAQQLNLVNAGLTGDAMAAAERAAVEVVRLPGGGGGAGIDAPTA